MQKILISACLLGAPVRYDGRSKRQYNALLNRWQSEDRLISFCPEASGGLPTPRAAAEIVGGDGYGVLSGNARVVDCTGSDVTTPFVEGAQQALALCKQHDIKIAILSARSPSCGDREIHDGRFSTQLKKGAGVTAALLKQHGITLFNQHMIDQIPPYLDIRVTPLTENDFKAFFPVFKQIIGARESYALDPDMDCRQAYQYWCQQSQHSMALFFDHQLAAIYYLKPNATGPAAHICNCGYMVAPQFRGKGLARILCQHSQQLARKLGYQAMQFNMVLTSNHAAVHLWQSMGFQILGTIPQAYRHATLGLVDGLIMHKVLTG